MVGDLVEPYWSQAEFYGAFEAGRNVLRAVVLKYIAIAPPPTISMGDDQAVRAIYDAIALDTPEIFYHAQTGHLDAIAAHYSTSDHTAMWRMICTPETFTAPEVDRVRRLNIGDKPRLDRLCNVPAALLERDPFFGIELDGEFVAVAGTHIFSPEIGIAVVGWVFTHPDQRGKGFATACTGAVTADYFRRGVPSAALNVVQDNLPAVRAYHRLGYGINNALWEGGGVRR